MEIKLTPQESEEYFYNALCNGVDYLFPYACLDLVVDDAEYEKAKKDLKEDKPGNVICREDVWMKVLKNGGKIVFKDEEGDQDAEITLSMIHEKVQTTPPSTLLDMVNETDDADTASIILQTVAYGDVIFG